MKVVSPFRPFAPESAAHRKLGPFDWIGALRMLAASVQQSNQCETFALTDVDTDLPVPAYRYVTTERRLMLWILEVTCCYLESADFDQDTALLSPDILALGSIRAFVTADLGLVVRPGEKYVHKPLLNGVQLFAHAAKARLGPFYRHVLAYAKTLPEPLLRWGADTLPLVDLLAPLEVGIRARAGLTVCGIDRARIFGSLSPHDGARVARGLRPSRPTAPLLDFKGLRKWSMRQYFAATIGRRVAA